MYIIQLYKEDWGILHMLGCQACSPEQYFQLSSVITTQTVGELYFGKSTTCGSLGVEYNKLSLDISGELCVSSSCISYPSSIQVYSRTCHRKIQFLILVAPSWMEALWLLSMLEDIPHQCPALKL